MRITEVKYGKTFNLGNYESERIDMSAEINYDIEDPIATHDILKRLVHEAYQDGLRRGKTEART